ncbi:hypothetical protein [Criibacterium bergeronii]|uniref:Lipoprotein n=1 Tax=Criibacterium bergeronii TaxID=1871336 RepID=A0A371IJ43_9FIRM|nr:hypothetical protein [Criibacterium bergeronii]MBS6062256.1 hypothetical protein [Peptostreptococcaceae bacterium]RDY20498.1 hypothetical protein BBG48_009735 [Criibacterium bergeronii]TRW28515.1 hypothetical protein FL857_00070 [Criibacterium bergeronii]
MKRKISLLLITLLASGALVACGGQPAKEEKATDKPATEATQEADKETTDKAEDTAKESISTDVEGLASIEQIDVLDSTEHAIMSLNDKATLEYFAGILKDTEKKVTDKTENFFMELPADAKESYFYNVIGKDKDGNEQKFDMVVYENYPYMTVKRLPVLNKMTWELSEDDNTKLQAPDKSFAVK